MWRQFFLFFPARFSHDANDICTVRKKNATKGQEYKKMKTAEGKTRKTN